MLLQACISVKISFNENPTDLANFLTKYSPPYIVKIVYNTNVYFYTFLSKYKSCKKKQSFAEKLLS